MLNFWKSLQTEQLVFGVPGITLLAVSTLLVITMLCRRLFSVLIIRYCKKIAARTTTTLDDALIDVLESPLSMMIVLAGFSASRILLLPYLNPEINKLFNNILQFLFVIIVCWFVFRGADVLMMFLGTFTRRTRSELDDLLLPYVSKVIKTIAVIIIIMKAAEIFLGMSAASLIGLLGGMGLTLGLVFKDIIANWFGCAIIYIDNLFRVGDWVCLDDGSVIDADVEHIGIRSTIFRNFDKTVSIVPNATIASAVIKNWSRMYKRRVKYSFTIDGIASDRIERILSGIRVILENEQDVHQEFHMVNFREFEGNARTIRLYYFTKTTVWKEHEQVRENVNLKILKLFEQEGIDRLAYTIVDLSDDRPDDFTVSREHEPER